MQHSSDAESEVSEKHSENLINTTNWWSGMANEDALD